MDLHTLFWYFEGKASDEEKALIKEWVDDSPENKMEFDRQRFVHDTLIMSTSESSVRAKRSTRWKTVARYSATAVCAFALACAFFLGFRNGGNGSGIQTITVPPGQRANVELPDGTNVWLNAGTTLSYPVEFMKKNREVKLDGEAYFDVTRNEKCPFTVRTSLCDVTVLGTKFDVEASSSRGVFKTALFEGQVRLNPRGTDARMFLLPGEKATLEGGRLTCSAIDDRGVYRWREGLYCFTEETFSTVLSFLQKYYGVEVVVQNSTCLSNVLTGKFRISDGPDYALNILQKSICFEYVREDDVFYIK